MLFANKHENHPHLQRHGSSSSARSPAGVKIKNKNLNQSESFLSDDQNRERRPEGSSRSKGTFWGRTRKMSMQTWTCSSFCFLSPAVKHGGSHSWSRSILMNSSIVSWLVGVSSNSFSLIKTLNVFFKAHTKSLNINFKLFKSNSFLKQKQKSKHSQERLRPGSTTGSCCASVSFTKGDLRFKLCCHPDGVSVPILFDLNKVLFCFRNKLLHIYINYSQGKTIMKNWEVFKVQLAWNCYGLLIDGHCISEETKTINRGRGGTYCTDASTNRQACQERSSSVPRWVSEALLHSEHKTL